ncbi:cation transport protein-domain-containing protein [Gloeopeniophorella convolvens]|nr:cation transport protein-domain-containing protein [Gloeopeniophorella convolvens]
MGEPGWSTLLKSELNFFRIHLAVFTLVPIISAGIFVASNGESHIKYIDALFVCISGITGTGLATIDLSSLTAWQQVIIALNSLIGSPVTVSLVAVYVRKRYFANHLYLMVKTEFERTKTQDISRGRTMSRRQTARRNGHGDHGELANFDGGMIRRVNTQPRPISSTDFGSSLVGYTSSPERTQSTYGGELTTQEHPSGQTTLVSGVSQDLPQTMPFLRKPTRRGTVQTINPQHKDDSFGGFGDPVEWSAKFLHRHFPSLKRNIHRTFTMSAAPRLYVPNQGEVPSGARAVPYLKFDARVGHNSRFIGLSDDDYEELGGLEYRALVVLLWIVSIYFAVTILIPFAVIAPYMSISRWKEIFRPPNQHRVIDPVWYSLFQIIGAWANTGMSLVDQNLVPFQSAYPLLILLIYVVLAGATAFPIFLRLIIWMSYKLAPKQSQWRDTLHFLLDHPRRCFIYLFPSRQTWFLFTLLILLNLMDWFFFLVLNIGIPAVEAVPVGQRVLLGLVQAVAVRLAGFQSIAISALAPALQVLYFVMMYISAYPIAMSVRSTNVNEERSLGIFEEDDDDGDIENEADYPETDSRVAIWGRYLGRHARRQLSFDMWWLALALFLVCISERGHLRNPDNVSWFNIFSVFFEIVSAYGTIGLSLGIPTANFSLSGAMNSLSKFIIILVMLRGRHRGLPVALDPAITLPVEFVQKASEKAQQMKREATAQRRLSPVREDATQ